MPLVYPSLGCRLATLATLGLSALPLAAQAELRPAILPQEICLVLTYGPFNEDIASVIQRRDDFDLILIQAERDCPDLLINLVGATASIPEPDIDNDDDGPNEFPVIIVPPTPPVDVVTIPASPDPDLPTEPPPLPDEGDCDDPADCLIEEPPPESAALLVTE